MATALAVVINPVFIGSHVPHQSGRVHQFDGMGRVSQFPNSFLFLFFCLLPLLLPCLSTRPCCCWLDGCLQIKGLEMGASRPTSCRHFFLFYFPPHERLCQPSLYRYPFQLRLLVACVCVTNANPGRPAQVDQSPAKLARTKKDFLHIQVNEN